jgi:hypothetical protein
MHRSFSRLSPLVAIASLVTLAALEGCSGSSSATGQDAGAGGDAGGDGLVTPDAPIGDGNTTLDADAEVGPDATGNDGASDAGGDVGDAVVVGSDPDTVRRRLTAVDALVRKLSSAGATTKDPKERLLALSKSALTIPDVTAFSLDPAGLDGTATLWDGETVSFSEGLDPDGTPPATPAPPTPPKPRSLSYSISPTKKALLLQMSGLGPDADAALANLDKYLSKAGYETTVGVPDLPTLRDAVSGFSVVYVNAHGEDGELWTEQAVTDAVGNAIEYPDDVDEPGTSYNYGLDCSGSSERDTTIAGERAAGLLKIDVGKYYNAAEDRLKYAVRYWITPAWVRAHWHLEPHAVVHFDACHTAESTKFSDAIKDVGGDAFLGWIAAAPYPGCYSISQRFWDDVLGTNLDSALTTLPQRPFDVDSVMDYMAAKQLDRVTSKGTLRTLTKISSGDSVILVPSIEHIEMGPLDAWFTVYGQFATTPGVISIGGVDTNCGDWTATKLDHCALPKIGAPGAYGPVVVDYQGRLSNPVPITHWKGTIQYTERGPSPLSEDIALQFVLRADVHRYRTKPGETPLERKLPAFFSDGNGATSCVWSYSGAGCPGNGAFDFVPTASPLCSLRVIVDTSLPEAQRFKFQPTMSGVNYPCAGGMTLAPDFFSDPMIADESPFKGSVTGSWLWVGMNQDTYELETRDLAHSLGPVAYDFTWATIKPDAPPLTTDGR